MLLALPSVTLAERRTALVIGNAAYEIAPLRNPVNDAGDMAAVLRQVGFEVTLLHNVPLRTMLEAIDTFSRQLRWGGVGLFYFAGHGVQVNGENYLIPLQATINREQDVPYEAVPVGRILGGMEDANNQLNMIILDACRDNPYLRSWRSGSRGLGIVQAVRGSLIAYATSPGSVAIDGDGRNGLYTTHLLQHMTTPGLSVEHLFKRIREGVVKDTGGKQTPWETSSLIGDFSFAPPAASGRATASSSAPAPPSPPAFSSPVAPDPEAAMWALVEKSGSPEDVTAFLTAYPHGRFAPAARLKLQQLERLASPSRTEEPQRPAEPERQQRELVEAKPRPETQRQAGERQPLEEVRQRQGQALQVAQSAPPPQPLQSARAEVGLPKDGERIGRFIKYANGTALDTTTNLVWMTRDFRNLAGRAPGSWDEAMAWATTINQQHYGGANSWRIPTTAEYQTIYLKEQTKRSFTGKTIGYPSVFEDGGGVWFWSGEVAQDDSLRYPGKAVELYGFDFRKGTVSQRSKRDSQGDESIRLVRYGP